MIEWHPHPSILHPFFVLIPCLAFLPSLDTRPPSSAPSSPPLVACCPVLWLPICWNGNILNSSDKQFILRWQMKNVLLHPTLTIVIFSSFASLLSWSMPFLSSLVVFVVECLYSHLFVIFSLWPGHQECVHEKCMCCIAVEQWGLSLLQRFNWLE